MLSSALEHQSKEAFQTTCIPGARIEEETETCSVDEQHLFLLVPYGWHKPIPFIACERRPRGFEKRFALHWWTSSQLPK
jgi:hypothetical protein